MPILDKQAAEARYARTRGLAGRDARPYAGPGQGAGPGQRRPQRRQDHEGHADLRQDGRAAEDHQGDREAARAAARPRRHRRHRRQHPDLLGGSRQGRLQQQLRPQDRHDRLRRRQDGLEDQVAPGAVNKLSVALLVDKSVPPAEFASLQKAVQSAAGVNPTRGARLPGRPGAVRQAGAPKAARCRRRSSARSSGPASASPPAVPLLHARLIRRREARDARPSRRGCARSRRPISLAELEAGAQPRGSTPLPRRACRTRSLHAARPADGARARARRRTGPRTG